MMDCEDHGNDRSVDELLLEEPSVYVKCTICNKVFSDPVVNIKCGHTFCKLCLLKTSAPGSKNIKCPIDGEVCALESLVVNRSVQDQIENLSVRCEFFNKLDGGGCTDVIKYGRMAEHKSSCAFVPIKCPWKPDLCPRFMRKDLMHHLDNCKFNKLICAGDNDEMRSELKHFKKQFDDSMSTSDQIKLLKTSIESIYSKIGEVSKRLKNLERVYEVEEVKHCLEQIEDDYERIEDVIKQGAHSLNIYRVPDDFWVMPFQFKCIGTMKCHSYTVTSIAVMDHRVFSTDEGGNVKIWDLDALEKGCQATLKVGEKKINSAIVYKDHLYTAGDDSTIRCWDSKLLEISSVIEAHEKSITSLLCSRQKLFSASFTNVKVWGCRTLHFIHVIKGLHHWARSLAFDVSRDKLYIGAHGTITIWKNSDAFESYGKISEPIGSVYSLVITNQFIIAGTYCKNIHIYDIQSLENVYHLTGHIGIINSLVSPSVQKFLVSCSSDSAIFLWCLENKLIVQAMQRHGAGVTCAAIVDDFLITGSEDREIKIFKQFKII